MIYHIIRKWIMEYSAMTIIKYEILLYLDSYFIGIKIYFLSFIINEQYIILNTYIDRLLYDQFIIFDMAYLYCRTLKY